MNVKMLLFEGGKSLDINNQVAQEGIDGVKRLLKHLDMLDPKQFATPQKKNKTTNIFRKASRSLVTRFIY